MIDHVSTQRKQSQIHRIFIPSLRRYYTIRSYPLAAATVSCCLPFVLLAASPDPLLVWIGRTAIAFLSAFCLLQIAGNKWDTASKFLSAQVVALLLVGFIGEGGGAVQLYSQIAQIAIFGLLVITPRTVYATPRFHLIQLGVILAFVVLNILWTVPPKEDDTHSFTQWVGIYGNPNALAFSLCAMFFLAFTSSLLINRRVHRIVGFTVTILIGGLVVQTGSRSAAFALAIYLFAVLAGQLSNGNKRILATMMGVTLLAVPLISIGYPVFFGQDIRFARSLSAPQEDGASAILQKPVCVPTALTSCSDEPEQVDRPTYGQREDGGIFGINKSFVTGRHIIWPAVIELSGESPIFGHGHGSLPGAYLAWPYQGRSAHNGFLQIYYQFGFVGFLLYVSILVTISFRALKFGSCAARSVAIATLCSICFLEIFEVILIQNQFGIGVVFVFLITTSFVPRDSIKVIS